ncbi:MAG: hypothetical protein ACLFQV_03465 [Vulcanimicrobiota bacterium]
MSDFFNNYNPFFVVPHDEMDSYPEVDQLPLYISFIWNFHQPLYKDVKTNIFELPWVRLQAVKSYYPMASFLKDYNYIKGTFNLTPSLIDQLKDYQDGMRDRHFLISEKPASQLTETNKNFIIQNFFINPKFAKIGTEPAFEHLRNLEDRAKSASGELSTSDWADIQLLHNLAWIHPALREDNTVLRNLANQPGGYTAEEKKYVLDFHIRTVTGVIKIFKEIQDAGKAEIITTPYYHPILPLIVDNYVARRVSNKIPLPGKHYKFPDDAKYHLEKARMHYNRLFEKEIIGLWPPELAVSREIIPIVARERFKWMVANETNLEKTLQMSLRSGEERKPPEQGSLIYVPGTTPEELAFPHYLYQPYRVKSQNCTVVIFFRDQSISDNIGIYYSSMDGKEAAGHLLNRLLEVWSQLRERRLPYVVTIALDGDNCWENYTDDSRTFLRTLYDNLDKNPNLETTTPQDFLSQFGARHTLPDLATGSWNTGSLNRWIGTPAKNKAWDYLYRVRKDLEKFSREIKDRELLKSAWEALYTAQGSDYIWWLDSTPNELASPFDDLLRLHLSNIYSKLGKEIPEFLNEPLLNNSN